MQPRNRRANRNGTTTIAGIETIVPGLRTLLSVPTFDGPAIGSDGSGLPGMGHQDIGENWPNRCVGPVDIDARSHEGELGAPVV